MGLQYNVDVADYGSLKTPMYEILIQNHQNKIRGKGQSHEIKYLFLMSINLYWLSSNAVKSH